jgi:hypothetical protein
MPEFPVGPASAQKIAVSTLNFKDFGNPLPPGVACGGN